MFQCCAVVGLECDKELRVIGRLFGRELLTKLFRGLPQSTFCAFSFIRLPLFDFVFWFVFLSVGGLRLWCHFCAHPGDLRVFLSLYFAFFFMVLLNIWLGKVWLHLQEGMLSHNGLLWNQGRRVGRLSLHHKSRILKLKW